AGNGVEQHIDAGPVPGCYRILREAALQLARTALKPQVPVATRDIGVAGEDGQAIFGFDDSDLAEFVEPGGEAAGETRGHVLGDEDGRAVSRHLLEHDADRLDPTGGGANGDECAGGR